MALEKFLNNVVANLDGAINNSTTSVVVNVGSNFPLTNFRIIIDDEICYCTSRSGVTLTVIRGTESTAAVSHSDGVEVAHIITAGSLQQLRLTALADVNKVPDDVSLSADDDNFDDETFSGWTKVADTTPVVVETEKHHTASFAHPGGGGGAQYIAYMKNKTPSAGDWIQCGYSLFGYRSGFPFISLILANGATYNAGNQINYGWDTQEHIFLAHEFTGYNSPHAFASKAAMDAAPCGVVHMKLVWEGSNSYSFYVSPDALTWATIFDHHSFSSLGTPSWMGFGFTTWGGGPVVFSYHYVRYSF